MARTPTPYWVLVTSHGAAYGYPSERLANEARGRLGGFVERRRTSGVADSCRWCGDIKLPETPLTRIPDDALPEGSGSNAECANCRVGRETGACDNRIFGGERPVGGCHCTACDAARVEAK